MYHVLLGLEPLATMNPRIRLDSRKFLYGVVTFVTERFLAGLVILVSGYIQGTQEITRLQAFVN